MPRTGINPSRGRKTDYMPARVTLAVLTYLPDTVAYYENRFDVTRLCLDSLIANTPEPYDLLVFDNGSSPQMIDHLRSLRDSGDIDYLLLSARNIGKIGALQMITRFAPGEIIAYTDDDIFFLPGWLETHLKVIDTYPEVGMVTGFYIRRNAGCSFPENGSNNTSIIWVVHGISTMRRQPACRIWRSPIKGWKRLSRPVTINLLLLAKF
jgi:GT2 family glycosyltransferase